MIEFRVAYEPKMRRSLHSKILIIGLLCSVLFVGGCSPSANSDAGSAGTTTSGNAGKPATFKVALITPGPVNDSGWNALAYAGLQAIGKQMNATTNNQVAEGSNIKDALRSYAQTGYNLVIGHGFEYNAPALQVAKAFPNTDFVTSSGSETAPNLAAFRFQLEDGFYIAGAMAAALSKTGTIGEVGGDQIPDIESTFVAFDAGAKSVKPGIKIIKVYTGSGTDIAAAKKATETEIDQGADVVIHQADDAAQGVFDACKERHVYAIGSNNNQNDNPSGWVIASATINCTPAFLQVAKSVEDHTFKGQVIVVGYKQGAIDFVWNPLLASKVSPAVKAVVAKVESGIKNGTISVPRANF